MNQINQIKQSKKMWWCKKKKTRYNYGRIEKVGERRPSINKKNKINQCLNN